MKVCSVLIFRSNLVRDPSRFREFIIFLKLSLQLRGTYNSCSISYFSSNFNVIKTNRR